MRTYVVTLAAAIAATSAAHAASETVVMNAIDANGVGKEIGTLLLSASSIHRWPLRYRVNGRRFTKTMHGTKTEAQKALRNLLHTSDTGAHVNPDKMKLAD